MKMMFSFTLTSVATALLVACSAEKVDLGNDEPVAQGQASLVAYAGDWVGYAEGYNFSDASDRVRIVIDSEGHGSIAFGDSPKPPEPDANQGFPSPGYQGVTERVGIDTFWPGFPYPLQDAHVEDSRLRLQTNTVQLFAGWCALFKPVFIDWHPRPYYACHLSAGGFGSPDGKECFAGAHTDIAFECGLGKCGQVCECDAQSCGVNGSGTPILFDGALEQDGKKLTGTLVKGDERIILRLTRG